MGLFRLRLQAPKNGKIDRGTLMAVSYNVTIWVRRCTGMKRASATFLFAIRYPPSWFSTQILRSRDYAGA